MKVTDGPEPKLKTFSSPRLQRLEKLLCSVEEAGFFPFRLPDKIIPKMFKLSPFNLADKSTSSDNFGLGVVGALIFVGTPFVWSSLAKKGTLQFSHVTTNLTEFRFCVNDTSKVKDRSRKRQKAQDAAELKAAQSEVEKLQKDLQAHGVTVVDAGVFATDPGMSDAQSCYVPTGFVDAELADRQQVVETIAKFGEGSAEHQALLADLEEKWGQFRVPSQFETFGVTGKLIRSENQQDRYQRQQARHQQAVYEAIPESKREELDVHGGLSGNVNLARVRVSEFRAQLMAHVVPFLRWRMKAYSGEPYSEQRFRNRRTKESITVRTIELKENIARKVFEESESGELDGEVRLEKKQRGSLPAAKRTRRTRKKNAGKKKRGRKARRKLVVEGRSPAGNGKKKVLAIASPHGDWNGKQMRGYRGNNSFPRMDMMRREVRQLREFAKNGRYEGTGVVVYPDRVNETRTTKQCEHVLHRIRGEQADRRCATRNDNEDLARDPCWKSLVCDVCVRQKRLKKRQLKARDPTSASNQAARYAQGKRHSRYKGVEAVAAGFVSRR
jgi:hypothetical protein